MPIVLCPETKQLHDFVTGRLPVASLESIAEHLETCGDCDRSVATMENESDSFLEELKCPASDESFVNEPEFRHVRQRVQMFERAADDAPSSTISNHQMLGQYMLIERLGTGGMGTVYKALHTKLEKFVAVKILRTKRMLDDHAVARFEREMKAIGKLKHENIVQASDAGEVDGKQFLVMEYLEGAEFSELIGRHGQLRVADACELVRQAAIGLQHAHEHGLVHRDVKPSNLMLSAEGCVKILDLGLAGYAGEQKLLAMDADDASETECGDDLTRAGHIMGTAEYMAPEQAANSHDVDIRADIYGLGCTLYALLAGSPPFRREDYPSPRKIIAAHQQLARPMVEELRGDVPKGLAHVASRMLATNPDDRFDTPLEVADALARFTSDSNLSALLATDDRPSVPHDDQFSPGQEKCELDAKRKPTANFGTIGALVMIAAFGLGLLGLFLFPSSNPPDISGEWTGEDWGQVELEKKRPGRYEGTYTDTFGEEKGQLQLVWSQSEGRFKGTWREGKDRFGKISLRPVDKEIRGAWTTSKKSGINPGTPSLADLLWVRGDPLAGNVALSSRGATVEGPASHPHRLLDGKTTGYHGTGGWARSLTPATWTVTLPREYPLRQIRLLLYDRDSRAFRYTIETSTDGKKYETVADHGNEWSRSWQVHSFPERRVRYIRVQCLDSTYNDRPREDGFFAVELEAYCRPPKARPSFPGGPINGSIGGQGKRSHMLEFSGRQAHLVIPKLRYDGSHPITIEATVMSLYRGSIIGDFNGSGLGLDVAEGYCSFHVNDGRATDNGYVRVKSSTSVGRNKLVHIAGVLDGSKLRLFVDGKLQGSATIGKFNQSKFPFMIGANPGGQGEPTQFLNGFIDEVRVSRTARYDEDFTAPSRLKADQHTLVLYRFDEGEGDVARDESGNALHAKIHGAKWVAAKAASGIVDSETIQRLRAIGVKITEKNGVATDFAFGNSPKINDDDLAAFESLGSLETVTLISCTNVSDVGFAHLRHLPRLQQLILSPSNITDAGLASVKGMEDLWMLSLNSTRVTDAGLRHLIDNRKITVLYLNNTKITDAGLAYLEQMKDMFWMDLEGTGTTDVGLARLGHMSKMRMLSLGGTGVTDAGLPRRQRFPELELLGLNRTNVTDAGMVHLAELSSLKRLILSDTRVTAAGLAHLAKLKNLKELQLLNTQITPAAVEELRKLLPKDCEIQHSFVLPAGALPIEIVDPQPAAPQPPSKIDNYENASCAVYSPDGLAIVSGGYDGMIRVWDLVKGTERVKIPAHRRVVRQVAVSPDGTKFASFGSEYKTIKLWQADGRHFKTLPGHKNNVTQIAFSPDGSTLVSAGKDGLIRLWEVASGSSERVMTANSAQLHCVVFSPDGKTIASGGEKTIQLWDADSGKLIRDILGHTDLIRSLVFSPDGTLLASAGDDKTIRIWNVADSRQIRMLNGHSKSIASLDFSPTGKLLASASGDYSIKVWELKNGTLVKSIDGYWPNVPTVAFSPDGAEIISAGFEKLILRHRTEDFSFYGQGADLMNWVSKLETGTKNVEIETDERGLVTSVHMGGGMMTDEGLSHLENLTDVEKLKLTYTYGCSAEGLRYVKDLTNVKVLNLWGNSNFSDGVGYLSGMTKMENLTLHKIRVTDENMKFLKDMKSCKVFQMTLNATVTDAGIAHLAGLTELESIYMTCPQLTDDCLKYFHDMHKLNSLLISSPHVTNSGFRRLSKALPNLKTVNNEPVEKLFETVSEQNSGQ